ncbi:MAG: Na+/H+ antiporter NhaA [Candidatus Latescibacteria bacterium]|nr:Na+/H+ antiporter NhaA [Candidatus Latescibacterota bacterium]
MSRKPGQPLLRDGLLQPLQDFLRLESAGGLILMAATLLALVVGNSPLAGRYAALLDLPLAVSAGAFKIAKPLLLWINDGLMAVFFFLVGLELKREVLEGHLSSPRRAGLPAFAAVGGMLVPALIYTALNRSDPVAMKGWAIPTATDIAFALGVLSLLGRRVPVALKAFLLSVAIFDDLGAIIVIAVFYTAELSALSLGVAGGLILVLVALNRLGVMRPAAYVLVGIPLWVAVLKSGVHATLAGVVLAMAIPLRASSRPGRAPGAEPPLRHLEHALHPWVAYGVLPVFAFANAGVPLAGLAPADMIHPVPLGIAAGLLFGKLAGVLSFSWLATRVGLASLPDGADWKQLIGIALLCGIGFTMSLFIASLAFEQDGSSFRGLERLGILVGSLVSGVAGYLVLRAASRSA